MVRRAVLACSIILSLVIAGAAPAGAAGPPATPGAPGIGDPYFPLAGNGGYDVRHYGLDITYTPETDVLAGVATITATATQHLSSFNLDFDGLTLRSLTVDGRPAATARADGELTVTPRRPLRKGHRFTVVARYDGVPQVIDDPNLGASGVFATDDGMTIVGQPEVASTWFPVNDHPRDKASYTIRITAPRGLEAVSNGVLLGHTTRHGWTTWTWDAKEPMASYLATATVGEYEVSAYRKNGVRYWDAIDPKLSEPAARPRTGTRMAVSQRGEPSYKRLTRTIAVPAGGADLSFWVTRDTEPDWDFFLVEARTAGGGDWTTLADRNGHTSSDPGAVCGYAEVLHPFLLHYVTPDGTDCTPSGTTGTWAAATGKSDGYEQWSVDLSAYAGRTAEVSLTVVNDEIITNPGVFVDDVVVSTGEGSTSFEDGLGGWTPGPAPEGSPPNPATTWISGTVEDTPQPPGVIAARAFAREPEIIGFLSGLFGRYPFSASGGIVDSTTAFGFALENQTRPVYAQGFFTSAEDGAGVVVHELAHQWCGDSLAVRRWQDIWLNEGFASYAEWLWSEREGEGTAQEAFDLYSELFRGDTQFWSLPIGDPGPQHLFDPPVYVRGAMTLHALRLTVGDAAFFRTLRTWPQLHAGETVTTEEFIAHAERVSGHQLDDLFAAWLYGTTQPDSPAGTAARARTAQVGPPSAVVRRAMHRGR
ncbi:M1 family aminopeptidase [Nucisporomicrobium flavum]|uniref:M1 family aminopeptidase n=1 Tax=Nucisporomicrobium flavum TaxID=2785915 RepID=UPI003C306BD5